MGYEDATSPWFRGNPPPSGQDDWRDWRVRPRAPWRRSTKGPVGWSSRPTKACRQTFAFEREDLQIRFRGDQAGFQELGAGRKVIVRYVEEDGEKVARSVEVYAGKRVSDEA